jgi:TIR domain
MQLFISHAQVDIEVAHTLRLRLDELSKDLHCFLLADEVFAGDNWEERIRAAAKSCDAILCLATADYIERPWFAAEWALFWFQEKPWYLALHDVSLEKVFKPLHGRQAVRLDDRRSVELLMRSLITHGSLASTAAPDLLADETVKAIDQAAQRARLARAESDLATFAVSLRRGTDNVDSELVERLVSIDRLESIMELASEADNWVALRQLAVLLLEFGEFDPATQLAERIENRAERRTIGIAALDAISRGHENIRATQLVRGIYKSVREPQRRDLRTAAESRGLDIDWPDVTANS